MGFKIHKGKNNCFLLGIYLEAVLFLLLEQPLVWIHLSEIEKKIEKKHAFLYAQRLYTQNKLSYACNAY